jgi:hypothetical protein
MKRQVPKGEEYLGELLKKDWLLHEVSWSLLLLDIMSVSTETAVSWI